MGVKDAGSSPCRWGLYQHPQQGPSWWGPAMAEDKNAAHFVPPLRAVTSPHSPVACNRDGAKHRSWVLIPNTWNPPRGCVKTQAHCLAARQQAAFLSPCRYHSISRECEGEKQAARDAGWLKARRRHPELALKNGALPFSFVPGSESLPCLLLLVTLPGTTFGAGTCSLVGVDSSAVQHCGAAGAGRKLPHWFCQERWAIMERHLAVFANKHCLPSCLTPSATQPNFPAPVPPQKWQPQTTPKSSC